MFLKETVNTFLFKTANIFVAIFLLIVFFTAGQNIVQTFPVAEITSLGNLMPGPIDYFWELNINGAPVDRDEIRVYADYYEQLKKVIPGARDVYGILGYCYHYLGDDARAIDYLKRAIEYTPFYSWNYYNLAAIYMNESRYQEALALYQKMQTIDPGDTLKRVFSSHWVYLPLIETGHEKAIPAIERHLNMFFRASIAVTRVLIQREHNSQIDGILKKMRMDLYAF